MDLNEFLFQVPLADGVEDTLPNTALAPTVKAFPDGVGLAVPRGQVVPGNSRFEHKEDSVDELEVISRPR